MCVYVEGGAERDDEEEEEEEGEEGIEDGGTVEELGCGDGCRAGKWNTWPFCD